MKPHIPAPRGGILLRLLLIPLVICALSAAVFHGLAVQGDRSRAALRASQERALDHTLAETVRLRGVVLENFAADYSLWNEMASFAASPTAEWAKTNLDGAPANFKLDGVWVFDASGKLSYEVGADTGRSLSTLLSNSASARVESFFEDGPFFEHFVVDERGTLLEFRGAKIQREDDTSRSSPPLGYLVVEKAWTPEYVEKFSPVVGGELSILGAQMDCGARDPDATHGAFFFGKPPAAVAQLCAVVQNPVSRQFEAYQSRTEVSFSLFVLFLLVTLGISLHQLILRPLRAIREGLRSEEHPDLLALSHAQTEFGSVARLVVAHARAVDEKTKLHAEVARAGKLASLGVVGAMVAHELNNPLAVVLGYAEVLSNREGRLDEPTNREAVEAILSHAERMRHVVDAVRALAWEQRSEPNRPSEDLNRIVRRSVQLFEPDLRRLRVRLSLVLDIDLPAVKCNHVQIETILRNLLENACEAMERANLETRSIEIHTSGTETDVELEVADSGPGVQAEVLENVFDPFISSKPVGTGSGLGLAICSAIAKDHGGSLVHRRSKHGGAAFLLRLPRTSETA